jgi:hypothetical protein
VERGREMKTGRREGRSKGGEQGRGEKERRGRGRGQRKKMKKPFFSSSHSAGAKTSDKAQIMAELVEFVKHVHKNRWSQ